MFCDLFEMNERTSNFVMQHCFCIMTNELPCILWKKESNQPYVNQSRSPDTTAKLEAIVSGVHTIEKKLHHTTNN